MKKLQASRSLAWIGGGAVLLVLLGAAIWLLPLRDWLVAVLEWIGSLGPWGPVALAGIYALACVLLIPGSILTLGAGFLFGLWVGTATAVAGSLLGISAAFLLGRTVARPWVERRIASRPAFRAIDKAVAREGFKIVLLTRLSPVFPFNLLNYAFGVTRISFARYFFASWIGMFPGTVLYVYLGAAARSLAELAAGGARGGAASYVLLGVGLVATIAVSVVLTRIARRALAGTTGAG